MTRRTPVEAFQSDWLSMADEVDRANERANEAEHRATRLLTENDMLRETINRLTTQSNYHYSWAKNMAIRLDVITEVIATAREEATKRAQEAAEARPEAVVQAQIVQKAEVYDQGSAIQSSVDWMNEKAFGTVMPVNKFNS